MWFKRETGRDHLFCDVHLVGSKKCSILWELAIQLEIDGLKMLTYLDKFSSFLLGEYKVCAKLIKTEQ